MKLLATLAGLAALLILPAMAVEVVNANADPSKVVANRYMVLYKEGADPEEMRKHEEDIASKAGAFSKGDKEGAFVRFEQPPGYTSFISEADLAAVAKSPLVASIEKDTITNGDHDPRAKLDRREPTTETHSYWGLVRISHRDRTTRDTYLYDNAYSAGIRVYHLSTGVNADHVEFEDLEDGGTRFFPKGTYLQPAGQEERHVDLNGQGTHFAAIIAGNTYGVARKAEIHSIKVLNQTGQGQISGVIAGISRAVSEAAGDGIEGKTIIHLPLSGTALSPTFNAAVQNALDSGLTVVTSAGDQSNLASLYSPSTVPGVITVGGIDGLDYRGRTSNYGPAVDIFAPGVSIHSAWIGNNINESAHFSGTGCGGTSKLTVPTAAASAFTAGVIAYNIDKEDLSGWQSITNYILSHATLNKAQDGLLAGAPNRLLYNDGMEDVGEVV